MSRGRWEDKADVSLFLFVLLFVIGMGLILGTCRAAWPATPYYPGGPAVRVYDGGTGAHDAATARRNLGIGTNTLVGFRDSLSSLYYTALLNPQIRLLDSQFWIKNASDTTKKAQFSAASIPTGTTRTYTFPDTTGTLAMLNKTQTFTRHVEFSPAGDYAGVQINVKSGSVDNCFAIYSPDVGFVISRVDPAGFNIAPAFVLQDPGTSAAVTIIPKAATTTNRTYKFDNAIASTDIMLTGGTQTSTGAKSFTGACVVSGASALRMDGTNTRTVFTDFNTTSKQMGFFLGNIAAATTRADTVPDIGGQLVIRANASDFLTQTANIATRTISTPGVAGMYRVSVYGLTDAIMTGTVAIVVGWTDPNTAQTKTVASIGTALNTFAEGSVRCQVASGNITVATTGYLTGTYELHIRVEGPL